MQYQNCQRNFRFKITWIDRMTSEVILDTSDCCFDLEMKRWKSNKI